MKRDTINTFNEGMVKDLHPLTTPNNVLTDALNATLVTYNGNELVLQNDMGNTQISNAFLPAGYVPVGMKEHGGIIYVAAYNPETKKGQVGSFPSPKQLWENEGWTVNSSGTAIENINIHTSDFYEGDYIRVETEKVNLFKYQDGFSRDFHPGDRYAITIPSTVNETLHSYVNDGKIKLQLGVIKSDGSIEIMADASEDWFFTPITLQNPNEAATELASGASGTISTSPRVFNASSSGNLILIINIITLDSFDLIREYELVEEGEGQTTHEEIKVTFKGQAMRDNSIVNNVGLFERESGQHADEYGKVSIKSGAANSSGQFASKSYMIYPELPYGYVERMGSGATIDFNRIRTSQGDFHEWRYFVTDQYIKIGWAYEFYNLGDKVKLEGIQMDFYDFVKPSTYPNNPDATVTFIKDSYSGNFEDYIRFDQYNIHPRRIYIVRISQILESDPTHPKTITHKMLYVSKFYNSDYNSVYSNDSEVDFSTCVEFSAPQDATNVSIEFDQDFVYEQNDVQEVNVRTPTTQDNTDYISMNQVNSSLYHYDSTEPTDINYITTVKNTYNGKLNIEAKYKNLNSEILGIPNQSNLQTVLTNISASCELTREVEWKGPYLQGYNAFDPPTFNIDPPSDTIVNNKKQFNISFEDSRTIQGKATEPLSDPYDTVEYRPVYDPDDPKRFDVFYGAESDNLLCLSGAKDSDIRYGSSIVNGSIVDGSNCESGYDDVGLTAANRAINTNQPPTVNIFAGVNGQDASLRFDAPGFHRRNRNGWDCGSEEVDTKDNFLAAVWKFTDGNCHFVNLFSKRDWPANKSVAWPRLDVMLRCFLSQIFIAQKVTKTATYITTDQNYYRYQDGKSILNITISTSNASTLFRDIMMPYENAEVEIKNLPLYNGNNDDLLSYWKSTDAGRPGSFDSDLTNLVNLIPKVNATVGSSNNLDPIDIEGEFNIDNLIKFYLGVSTASMGNMDVDPTIIKVVDMGTLGSNNTTNAAACYYTSNNKPSPLPDGAFKWTSTPVLKNAGIMSSNARYDTKDTLYDWQGNDWKMYISLNRMFKTSAAVKGWKDLSNGEFNELLANQEEAIRETCPREATGSGTRDWYESGKWVEGRDRDAPDLYFNVLTSNKSIYKPNYITQND